MGVINKILSKHGLKVTSNPLPSLYSKAVHSYGTGKVIATLFLHFPSTICTLVDLTSTFSTQFYV